MDCYRTSNNKFFQAPPRMADARHFTDYRPNCHVNNLIKNDNEVFNSYEYRLFLTRNADQLIDANRQYAFLKNGVSECKSPYNQGTMLPEETKVVCNKQNCRVVMNNENGLGQGRIYAEEPNELLDPHENPKLNKNYCTPPKDNFRYYPDNHVDSETVERQSLHSGGNILEGGDPSVYH
jgi:hypothetical protein